MGVVKPKLGIDLDGTIAQWDPRLNEGYHRRGYGDHPMLLDPRLSYNLMTGVKELDAITLEIMAEPGFYAELKPMPGFVEALPVIEQHFDVEFVTQPWAGNRTCASDKYAWIEDVLGEKYVMKTTLTYDKTLLRVPLLIDDKPKITGALVPEWTQVVYEQPYNTLVAGPRIRNWGEPERLVIYLLEVLATTSKEAVFV